MPIAILDENILLKKSSSPTVLLYALIGSCLIDAINCSPFGDCHRGTLPQKRIYNPKNSFHYDFGDSDSTHFDDFSLTITLFQFILAITARNENRFFNLSQLLPVLFPQRGFDEGLSEININ